MSFDWSEYLSLAKELAGQECKPSCKEARLRSSISRAYFAAHCKAKNQLDNAGVRNLPRNGRIHGFVIDKFKTSGDRTWREIGTNLDRLRVDRKKADYKNYVRNLSSLVEIDIKMAKKVLSLLKKT